MLEPVMTIKEIRLEPVWMVAVYAIDIDGQPLKDNRGHVIRDNQGRVVVTIR